MRMWLTTTENKMFLRKFCNTCCYHNIFTIVEVSVSYRSNNKCYVHNIFILILQQIIGGKLLLMNKKVITIVDPF